MGVFVQYQEQYTLENGEDAPFVIDTMYEVICASTFEDSVCLLVLDENEDHFLLILEDEEKDFYLEDHFELHGDYHDVWEAI